MNIEDGYYSLDIISCSSNVKDSHLKRYKFDNIQEVKEFVLSFLGDSYQIDEEGLNLKLEYIRSNPETHVIELKGGSIQIDFYSVSNTNKWLNELNAKGQLDIREITDDDVGREFKTYSGDIYKITYFLEDIFDDGDHIMLKKYKGSSRGMKIRDFLLFFNSNKCQWLN